MVKESKYCRRVTKKHFNKELVMTKEGNEKFESSTKCWVCDNNSVEGFCHGKVCKKLSCSEIHNRT